MSVRWLDAPWKCVALSGLLLILQLCGAAQESITAAPVPSSKTNETVYSLSGSLINSVTGEPLRRAAVQIMGQAAGAALTDDAGHFFIEGLPEGQVFVTAMKPGFYESQPGTGAVVGRDGSPVVLKMTPCGAIVGRVTTRDGKPLEGFRISLIVKQVASGRSTWSERPNQGVTNEDGEFRIAGLQADHYYVVVDQGQQTSLGERGVVNAREQGYARVLYPGVSDLAAASPVEVIPGRETEANFSLIAEPLYQVSGAASTGVMGLAFQRQAGSESDFSLVANVQDGKFEAKVPAGAYVVSGGMQDGVLLSTPGASVVVSGDNADLRVSLAAVTGIPVKILAEHAGSGAAKRLSEEELPPLRIEIESASHIAHMTRWWNPRSQEIDNVEAGAYVLNVQAPAPWWVKSAQYGGVDVLSDEFTVGEGGSLPIEITLRDDAGMVTGTVAGAAQWSQSMVLLVPMHGKANVAEARAMTGNFAFQGVAPGDYAVVAIDHGEQVEYANPDVLSLYLSSAQQIHVAAHGTATVNLTVTPVRR